MPIFKTNTWLIFCVHRYATETRVPFCWICEWDVLLYRAQKWREQRFTGELLWLFRCCYHELEWEYIPYRRQKALTRFTLQSNLAQHEAFSIQTNPSKLLCRQTFLLMVCHLATSWSFDFGLYYEGGGWLLLGPCKSNPRKGIIRCTRGILSTGYWQALTRRFDAFCKVNWDGHQGETVPFYH